VFNLVVFLFNHKFTTTKLACSPFFHKLKFAPMPVLFSSRSLILSIIVPLLISIALYKLDTFDPAIVPSDAFTSSATSLPPLINDEFLTGAEFIGVGLLNIPEDIAYHKESNLIYTGCVDGWVKRVKVADSVNDSVVEDWVNTGGRPLGIAFGIHGEVIVADVHKVGVLKSNFEKSQS